MASCLSLGCEKSQQAQPEKPGQEEDDIYLAYATSSEGNWGTAPVEDACWLAGPNETLVLATIKSVSDYITTGDCMVPDPYRRPHLEVELVPTRTAGPVDIVGPLTALAFVEWTDRLLDLEPGDAALVSLRISDGVPFVVHVIEVQTTAQPTGPSSVLPSDWASLETEVLATQRDHATLCTKPTDQAHSDTRQMTDAEFDAWIRTPVEKKCESNAMPEREPAPGTIEQD